MVMRIFVNIKMDFTDKFIIFMRGKLTAINFLSPDCLLAISVSQLIDIKP